jgi:hypothetical protein
MNSHATKIREHAVSGTVELRLAKYQIVIDSTNKLPSYKARSVPANCG